MKALIYSLLFLAAVSVHGQGRVAFANGSTTPITHEGQPISGAGTIYFGLYVGPLGSTEIELTLVLLATNTALAGRLSGGSPVPLPAPWGDGSPLAFQVRGWSAAGGHLTWDDAYRAAESNPSIGLGRSIIGQVTPTFSPNAAAPLFGNGGGGLVPGFKVGDLASNSGPLVPEPSTIALGALGVAAMMLFRRKK